MEAILRFCGGYTQFRGGYTLSFGGYTTFCGGYTVGQPITLSIPTRVEVELGCDNNLLTR